MEREDAKVGNLEMRAKVRGEVWVKRLTAGRDIVKEELGGFNKLTQLKRGREGEGVDGGFI